MAQPGPSIQRGIFHAAEQDRARELVNLANREGQTAFNPTGRTFISPRITVREALRLATGISRILCFFWLTAAPIDLSAPPLSKWLSLEDDIHERWSLLCCKSQERGFLCASRFAFLRLPSWG